MPVESGLRTIWPENCGDEGFDHKLDIVFVHGLNPTGNINHASEAWTTRRGTMWPKDLLPDWIPHARVMLFEYNSSAAFGASETDLRGHANSFLDTLLQSTREDSEILSHPMILVGHSLGGLLIKQALVLAKQNNRVYGALLQSVQGIAFFATPHRGGNGVTLGDVVARTASFVLGSGQNDMVRNLRTGSKALAQLSADFSHQYEDFQFLSVIESVDLIQAPMNPIRTLIVDRASAELGLPGHRERVVELQRDHSQICKFEAEEHGFKRVIKHLRKMAHDACGGSASIAPSTIPISLADGQVVPRPSAMYSTLYQNDQSPLVGQVDLVKWLHFFLKAPHEMYLILHGPAGTGKSKVVSEVSSRWSSRVSVFWFDAESQRSIERGFQTVADLVKMRKPPQGHQAKRTFKDWLSDELAAPWLAVFDNAFSGLDLRGLLPKTGGKVIITARHTDIHTDSGFAVKSIQSLHLQDATELFASRYTHGSPRQPADVVQAISPTITSVLQSLIDRPLAILFAATCVSFLDAASAADHLQSLVGDQVPSAPPTLDPKIWKWACHVLEELDPDDAFLLSLLCLFDGDEISDPFLAILSNAPINGAQRNEAPPGGTIGGRQYITSRQRYTTIIHRLQKLHLVQRRRNPVRQHYHIPKVIRECVTHYLPTRRDQNSIGEIIHTGAEILHSALKCPSRSKKDDYEVLRLAYPHIQALCLNAKACNVLVHREFHVDRFALAEATRLMKCFSHRQLWRTWLLKGNFPLNEANQGEDDGAEPIVYPILAPWLVEMSVAGKSSTLQGLRTIISKLIASSFCEDLRVCTIVAVVGQCWHGVREDIFNFLRTHPGLTPRNAAVIDEIIDFVDKGACTGLQTVLVTYTSSDEYALQAAQDCETALDDVINVITAGLRSAGIDLTSANLETLSAAKVAVEKSWESIRSSSFFQMCGAFESVFKGYIEQAVCADIGSKLSMTIEPKGFETEMANMLPLLVTHEVKERISLVSQGYWEVMSDLSLLIAADVLRELSRVVETTSLDTGGFGSPSAKLMTIAIELVREVLMSSTGTSPGWKLTLGKAGFWCVQAEKSRDAREVYRNLDRWDEYRFFSGSGGNWPINDVF